MHGVHQLCTSPHLQHGRNLEGQDGSPAVTTPLQDARQKRLEEGAEEVQQLTVSTASCPYSVDQNLVIRPPLATKKARCGHEPLKSSVAPKAHSIKDEIGKLDFIKVKNFSSVRDTGQRMRQQANDLENRTCLSQMQQNTCIQNK